MNNHEHHSDEHAHHGGNPTQVAIAATLHCLTGCAIGEVLGMILSTWWGWSNTGNVILSITLAFAFGYGLTIRSLLQHDVPLTQAARLAGTADTFSIATMEIVDTLVIIFIPGAISAGLGDPLFWGSLIFSLFVAFWAAVPVNRWLIIRGKGHAVVHAYH